MFAVGQEKGAVGKLLVELQLIEIATEFARGRNFWINLFEFDLFPDQFAQFEGDFPFAGFGFQGFGIEAINRPILQGFPDESLFLK
ncbi:hypothetical protein L8106_23441 [Lyngbya sp. PCC 8106]|nr:hypothetical protein [Lyngbya sp. PCC 8106]EAW36336.1 hypothetical protein L8106_23441 [Lyngbya sp. PCC 8106]